jgi:hypothetical protein
MNYKERLYYAQTEFINSVAKYNQELFLIEMSKSPKYLYDPYKNTMTRIIVPPTIYEKWLHDKIESIGIEIYKRFNIESYEKSKR